MLPRLHFSHHLFVPHRCSFVPCDGGVGVGSGAKSRGTARTFLVTAAAEACGLSMRSCLRGVLTPAGLCAGSRRGWPPAPLCTPWHTRPRSGSHRLVGHKTFFLQLLPAGSRAACSSGQPGDMLCATQSPAPAFKAHVPHPGCGLPVVLGSGPAKEALGQVSPCPSSVLSLPCFVAQASSSSSLSRWWE